MNTLLAVTTLLAVLIALFQERIRRYWNRAVLDMEINLTAPDSRQIELYDSKFQVVERLFYIRIKVMHKKGAAGENVEIMPTNFWRVGEDNRLSEVEYFLPISLTWSHFQPKTSTIRVPVRLFRHCDFGYLKKDIRNGYPQSLLILNTITQPNAVGGGEVPNVIGQGKFQFELLLSGDNVKTLRRRWEIEFNEWSDNENEMRNTGIKLKEVK